MCTKKGEKIMYKRDYHPDTDLIFKTKNYNFDSPKSVPLEPLSNALVQIDAALKKEETERIAEDVRINARVDKEITDRENADQTLKSEICKITPSIKFLRFGKDDFSAISGSPVNVEVYITMLKINDIVIMFHRVIFTGNKPSNFISYTAQLDLTKVIPSGYKVSNFSIWHSLTYKDDNISAIRSNDIQIINMNRSLYYQTKDPTGCVFCGTTICKLSE